MLPETAFSFALSRLPATSGAAATTAMMLLLMLFPQASLKATVSQTYQETQAAQVVTPMEISELERELQGRIICMCGGCRAPINDCPMLFCHSRDPQKAELHKLVEDGKSRDEIIAWFVAKYGGQDVLGAPIDKGFNRLAWLFPYLVGAGSAVAVGLVAMRFSRRHNTPEDAPVTEDPALEERLDDELRDLD
jgi:cytochrome c-type biogenesis protein CcmH/NrfF